MLFLLRFRDSTTAAAVLYRTIMDLLYVWFPVCVPRLRFCAGWSIDSAASHQRTISRPQRVLLVHLPARPYTKPQCKPNLNCRYQSVRIVPSCVPQFISRELMNKYTTVCNILQPDVNGTKTHKIYVYNKI